MVPHLVPFSSQMGKKEKLHKKAKESPGNIRFSELCSLAKYAGFEFRKKRGSHETYKHPDTRKMLNFQPDKKDSSKAKTYQIKQLLDIIEEGNLLGG